MLSSGTHSRKQLIARTGTVKQENVCWLGPRPGCSRYLRSVGLAKNFMTEFRFFDTNVLLYMYDQRNAVKHVRAVEVFRYCLQAGTLIISTQVVQEFYAAATRKLHLNLSEAHDLVADLCGLRVIHLQCSHILRATEVQRRFGISFWDALILAAAQAAGAHVLYTEDLQDGQDYDGVKVQNPFEILKPP